MPPTTSRRPNRRFPRKQPSRQSLVDDDDRLGVVAVVARDVAAFQQRHAHRADDGAHDAVDRGVGADGDCQDEHSRGGKDWIPSERASGKTHILDEAVKRWKPARVAMRLPQNVRTAQGKAGLAAGLLWRFAAGHRIRFGHREVRGELGVEIAFLLAAGHLRPCPRQPPAEFVERPHVSSGPTARIRDITSASRVHDVVSAPSARSPRLVSE